MVTLPPLPSLRFKTSNEEEQEPPKEITSTLSEEEQESPKEITPTLSEEEQELVEGFKTSNEEEQELVEGFKTSSEEEQEPPKEITPTLSEEEEEEEFILTLNKNFKTFTSIEEEQKQIFLTQCHNRPPLRFETYPDVWRAFPYADNKYDIKYSIWRNGGVVMERQEPYNYLAFFSETEFKNWKLSNPNHSFGQSSLTHMISFADEQVYYNDFVENNEEFMIEEMEKEREERVNEMVLILKKKGICRELWGLVANVMNLQEDQIMENFLESNKLKKEGIRQVLDF